MLKLVTSILTRHVSPTYPESCTYGSITYVFWTQIQGHGRHSLLSHSHIQEGPGPLAFLRPGAVVGLPCPSLRMDSLIHVCFSVIALGTFRGMKQACLGSCCQGLAKVEKNTCGESCESRLLQVQEVGFSDLWDSVCSSQTIFHGCSTKVWQCL